MSASGLHMPAFSARPAAIRQKDGLWTRILQRLSLHRQRSRLAELDDHMLSDIGVTRSAARTEASRPVWDAPDHWLR